MGGSSGDSGVPHNPALVAEVEDRLEQLNFILARVGTLEQERIEYVGRSNTEPDDGRRLRDNAFEIRLLA
jgi:hypothetical protein